MKIAIISDIHANAAALNAFSESYDELWVIGDLVNFVPHPGEAIDWVRGRAHCVVRGNHDHAVGYGVDPRCAPTYQLMAEETMRHSATVLTQDQKKYLRLLPLTAARIVDRTRFYLCHATPADPLFGYLGQYAWVEESLPVDTDTLLVGHTHEPFLRTIGPATVVNPGSLAGLRVTSPEASYAIWEDGQLQLKRYSYPFEDTVSAIWSMPISQSVKQLLSDLVVRGDLQRVP